MKVRKIVAGLAAVSMLAAFSAQSVFAADTVTIKAGEATAAPGENFTLDVSLDGVPAQGISAIEFAVTYDPAVVTVNGVEAGAITKNGVDDTEKFDGVTVFEAVYETAGLVTLTYSTGLSDAQYCITDSGVFATISGTVAEGAKDGEYPITVTAIGRETVEGKGDTNKDAKAGYIDADGNVTKYATTLAAGKLTVANKETPTETDAPTETDKPTDAPDDKPAVTLWGDSDNDGAVDITDVIRVNKFLLGSGKLDAQAMVNCDVDQKNGVDTTDSLNILKLVVEMLTQADMPLA